MADGTIRDRRLEKGALAAEAQAAAESTSPWFVYGPAHARVSEHDHDKRGDAARAMRGAGVGSYIVQDGHVRQHHDRSTEAHKRAVAKREGEGVYTAEWERWLAEEPNIKAYDGELPVETTKPTLAELDPGDDDDDDLPPAAIAIKHTATSTVAVKCARGCDRAPGNMTSRTRAELAKYCTHCRNAATATCASTGHYPPWVTGDDGQRIGQPEGYARRDNAPPPRAPKSMRAKAHASGKVTHAPRPKCKRCDASAGPVTAKTPTDLEPYCVKDRKRAGIFRLKHKRWPGWMGPPKDVAAAPVGECRHCKGALTPARLGHPARPGTEAWCKRCRNRVSGSIYANGKLPDWAIEEGFPAPEVASPAPTEPRPTSSVPAAIATELDTTKLDELLVLTRAHFAKPTLEVTRAEVEAFAVDAQRVATELLAQQRADHAALMGAITALAPVAPPPPPAAAALTDPRDIFAADMATVATAAVKRFFAQLEKDRGEATALAMANLMLAQLRAEQGGSR